MNELDELIEEFKWRASLAGELSNSAFAKEDFDSFERQKLYKEYSDVMLKMWIDKLVTDSEYNRIMNRLNDKFRIER